MHFPNFSPAEQICNTSIEDGTNTLKQECDIRVIKSALKHELNNKKRKTMIKALKNRIKRLSFNKLKAKAEV